MREGARGDAGLLRQKCAEILEADAARDKGEDQRTQSDRGPPSTSAQNRHNLPTERERSLLAGARGRDADNATDLVMG
jgi:hypothetical protein